MPLQVDRDLLGQRYGRSGKIEAEVSFLASIPCGPWEAMLAAYPRLDVDRALRAVMQIGLSRAKMLCLGDLHYVTDSIHREAGRLDCLCEVVEVVCPMVEKERLAFELLRERLQVDDEQAGLVCLMLGLRQIEGRL